MRDIHLFIASSIKDFPQERDALSAAVDKWNKAYHDYNIFFYLDRCEHDSHAVTPRRKQETFNDQIRRCDFFFALVGERVGPATVEEINVAMKQFSTNGELPHIVLFFQDGLPEVTAEVKQLKARFRRLEQYTSNFSSVSDVVQRITDELIVAGAFRDPERFDRLRKDHEAALRQIRDNRKQLSKLYREEPTRENQNKRLILYQENASLALESLSELNAVYEYACFLHEIGYHEKAIETGTQLEAFPTVYAEPDDIGGLKNLLGDCYAALGRYEYAETYYRAALEAFGELDGEDGSDAGETCVKLASVMRVTGRPRAAERLYRAALDWYLRDPEGNAPEVCDVCDELQELVDASRDYELDSIRKAGAAFASGDGLDAARDRLSHWLTTVPCPDPTAQMIAGAEEVARKMTTDNPEAYERILCVVLNNTGEDLRKHHQMEDAEVLDRKALDIADRLAQRDPDAFEPYVATDCNSLALVLQDTNRPLESERRYREALDFWRRRAQQDPDAFESYAADTCNNLAALFDITGRYKEAETYYREALDILRRRAQQDPDAFESYVAVTCNNLALLFTTTGQSEEAERYFQEAFEIYHRRVKQDPRAVEPSLAETCYNYGNFLLRRKNDPGAAREFFYEAATLFEKYPHLQERYNLAVRQWKLCVAGDV